MPVQALYGSSHISGGIGFIPSHEKHPSTASQNLPQDGMYVMPPRDRICTCIELEIILWCSARVEGEVVHASYPSPHLLLDQYILRLFERAGHRNKFSKNTGLEACVELGACFAAT